MRIIFYGTPQFAVPSLQLLVAHRYHVVAVVTAADAPAGRGLQLKFSPVKEFALEHHIPVLQPAKLKDTAFIEHIKSLQPDLQIVVAFRMMPQELWSLPPLGTFNLHASLLPQYRGAAPINWAIINGETETGVTTFFLRHEIDTGNIIFNQKESIAYTDNATTLHNKLMHTGAALVIRTVQAIEKGHVQSTPQNTLAAAPLKTAPKIYKETCRIQFNNSAAAVYNFIRGLAMYPAAYTDIVNINGQSFQLKIYDAEPQPAANMPAPGTVHCDGKTFLKYACSDGWISVKQLQLQGKKIMTTVEFLRGFRVQQSPANE